MSTKKIQIYHFFENRGNMNAKKVFGLRLRQFRKSLKMTLKDLENESCLSYSNIGRIERGEIFPSFEFLVDLRNKYNLNLNWFSTGKGKMLEEHFNGSIPSIKDIYPDIPDDEYAAELIKCLQVPVIYHFLVATFITLQKQHQNLIDEYFNKKEEENLNVNIG